LRKPQACKIQQERRILGRKTQPGSTTTKTNGALSVSVFPAMAYKAALLQEWFHFKPVYLFSRVEDGTHLSSMG